MNAQMTAQMSPQMTEQTTENAQMNEKRMRRLNRDFTWMVEVLLMVCVTPALVYGVTSLSNLPIA